MEILVQSVFGLGPDFSAGGVQVRLRQSSVTMLAKLSATVADEDALRSIWSVEGCHAL